MHIALGVRAKFGGITYQVKPPEKPRTLTEEQHLEGLMAYGQKTQPDSLGI